MWGSNYKFAGILNGDVKALIDVLDLANKGNGTACYEKKYWTVISKMRIQILMRYLRRYWIF